MDAALQETVSTAAFRREWLADGQVLCYRLINTERTTVDACGDDLAHLMADWQADRPLRLLLDLCSDGAVITAYALGRAREVCRLRPDVRGMTAVVTTNRITATIASMALRGLPNAHRARLIFPCEYNAVTWLLRDVTITA